MRCRRMSVSRGDSAVSFVMVARADWAAVSTILPMEAIVSMSGDISSASSAVEAMFAPPMSIAPTCPRANAEENAVIEITRSIITSGCAAIG